MENLVGKKFKIIGNHPHANIKGYAIANKYYKPKGCLKAGLSMSTIINGRKASFMVFDINNLKEIKTK